MISLVSPDICITYVYIDIYIYIVQRICASEGQIASSIGRIDFPEVPLMSNSPFNLDETKTVLRFYNLLQVYKVKYERKTS